jgi:hypothetical protein
MQGSALKLTRFVIMLVPSLTIVACAGNSGTPTAPTVAGPAVAAPTPEPARVPAPTAPDEGTPITVRGAINRMSRSGPDGIDVLFRIGDEPWVRGDAATTVLDGSSTGNTTNLRDRQTVTIDGRQRADHVYAKHVTIDTKP